MYYRPGLWHYTLVTKITPGDNCHGWSPSILRMVAHQPKYGHPPTLGWSPTRRKCTTDLEFSTYILLTKLTSGYLLTKLTPGYLPTLRGSHTNPRSVAHQPKYGHPTTLGWSPTRRKCTIDMEFGTYTLLAELTPGDNCH